MQFFTPDSTNPGSSQWLLRPVNNSGLIIFRIIFGFLLFFHFAAALRNGTIYHNFIEPPFTFSYIGLEWLQPLPGNGMYYYVAFMLLLALLIMLGAWYRVAMPAFAILYTILYLMQKSGYNNHYYLMLLLCWIMVFMPANQRCSVDVKRGLTNQTDTCARYCIWMFIMQVAIMYFYAALAKLTSDWFSGKYIAIQFSGLTSHRFVGTLYGKEWFQLLICYTGFLFDLLIVPLLLWKKSRKYAFIASCLFHLFNAFTFRIGIFPYLSIALNIFFFNPLFIQRLFSNLLPTIPQPAAILKEPSKSSIIPWCFYIYFIFQLLIPIRSWFFPGNVFWTEEGYRLSWKMMMRTKSGTVYFRVKDPATGMEWKEDPSKIFTASQMMWLSISPDIIWQYAQRLKKEYKKKGITNAEVYAIGAVSLNRNKAVPMVDSTADLAKLNWEPFRHSTWITDH